MRSLRLLTIAALLSPVVGCNWMKEWRNNGDMARRGKIQDVSPDKLVGYLNKRASLLQAIEYDKVSLRCYERGMPTPEVNGNLACAQPRNFRMHVSKMNGDVDLGSNSEQFWVYMKVPGDDPVYVYASHTDYESGRARLPGGIPFDPDWVMQAFGMTVLPPANPYEQTGRVPDPLMTRRAGAAPSSDHYSVSVNERDRTYTLSWPSTTPGGTPVRKEIVFDVDAEPTDQSEARGGRQPAKRFSPRDERNVVVKKHVVRDEKNTVIAWAEIKSVQTVQMADPQTGAPVSVQYPTHVVLKWELQKFEMDLRLQQAQVNPPLQNDSRRLFVRPEKIGGVGGVDLARYQEIPRRR